MQELGSSGEQKMWTRKCSEWVVGEKGPDLIVELGAGTPGLPKHWTGPLRKCCPIRAVKGSTSPCRIEVPLPPATKTSIFTEASPFMYQQYKGSFLWNTFLHMLVSLPETPLSTTHLSPVTLALPFHPSRLYSSMSPIRLSLSPLLGALLCPHSFPKASFTRLLPN